MAKFAEYGFNKSHSAAYALIAYQTAYLKAHYPVEFMAALLTEDMGNTDKIVKNINDCREMGIEVLPPDINESGLSFRVIGKSIRFGLGAIKNVGESAIQSILEARKDEPFTDIFNFCERVDLRKVNKRVVESLVKCGAFDSTSAKRSALFAVIEEAANIGQRIQEERDSAQVSLFGTAEIVRDNGNGHGNLPDIKEWDEKMRLTFEKECLGFYISGHPLGRFAAEMKRFSSHDTASLAELSDKAEARLCGVVVALKEFITKKGERMGFVTIEDLVGSVEVVVLPNIFQVVAEFLKSDEPLLVAGSFERGEKSNKIIASSIQSLLAVNERETKAVNVRLESAEFDASRLDSLKEIMRRHHGSCQTRLHIVLPDLCTAVVRLPRECSVAPTEGLSLEVENLLGYNAVTFE